MNDDTTAADDQLRRIAQLEADLAALREAITRYKTEYETKAPFDDPDLRLWAREHLEALLAAEHPGAALLTTADALCAAARAHLAQSGIDSDDRALMEAVEHYEQLRKGATVGTD